MASNTGMAATTPPPTVGTVGAPRGGVRTPRFQPHRLSHLIGARQIGGEVQRAQADPGAFALRGQPTADPMEFQRRQFEGPGRVDPDEDFRRQQAALIQGLQQPGPSVAEQQLQQGLEAQQRQALSLAASQRGVNPGLALRQAQQAQTQAGLGVQQQMGQLRAQEEAQRQGLLAQTLAGARGQDLETAGMGVQMRGQDIQAALQTQQMADQMTQFYEAQGLSRDEAQLQASMALAELESRNIMEQQRLASEIARANVQSQQQTQAGLLGLGGQLIGQGLGLAFG